MPNEVKLLPCPFCGAEPQRLHQMDGELSDAFWHPEAECILSMCGLHRDKWLGWNTRPTTVVAGEHQDLGVPASPSGHSAEPEPCSTVSAVPVSVPNAWQPIETAPRDGSVVLLASETGSCAMGRWWPEGDAWCDEYGRFPKDAGFDEDTLAIRVTGVWASGGGWFQPDEVTHWMPLPEPPASAIEARRAADSEAGAVHESAVGSEASETPKGHRND